MLIRKDNLWSRAQNLLHAQSKKSVYKLHLSIHINSSKFSVYFTRKNLLFLVYTSTFTKHLHQFIYSTHLFNKIFIILLIFIIHSRTDPQPPSPPSHHHHTYPDQRRSTQTSTPPHLPRSTRSTQTHSHHHHQQPSAINTINPDPHTQNNPIKPYPDQPTTQINPDQANPHKSRPTHTINSD